MVNGSLSSSPCKDQLAINGYLPSNMLWTRSLLQPYRDSGLRTGYILYADISSIGLFKFFVELDTTIGTCTTIDMFRQATRFLQEAKNHNVFLNIHFGLTDWLSHRHGQPSPELAAGINEIEQWLKWFIATLPSKIIRDTVLSICADHGHSFIDPSKLVLIEQTDYQKLVSYRKYPPPTEGRYFHLYCKYGRRNKLVSLLKHRFRG
ncbi:MAG: alkaline phosphatase family protein [Candidatus Ranarchaeia archaeon]